MTRSCTIINVLKSKGMNLLGNNVHCLVMGWHFYFTRHCLTAVFGRPLINGPYEGTIDLATISATLCRHNGVTTFMLVSYKKPCLDTVQTPMIWIDVNLSIQVIDQYASFLLWYWFSSRLKCFHPCWKPIVVKITLVGSIKPNKSYQKQTNWVKPIALCITTFLTDWKESSIHYQCQIHWDQLKKIGGELHFFHLKEK